MRVVDPGHKYLLDGFDQAEDQEITFMKRKGKSFPFNRESYGGTNSQEVIRALIDRTKYLDSQIPSAENDVILSGLRTALLAYELRAARRHGLVLPAFKGNIEDIPTCRLDGHIVSPKQVNPREAQ